jgi:hypothetical protein
MSQDWVANWLGEHLPYELKMLRFTLRRLQQLQLELSRI